MSYVILFHPDHVLPTLISAQDLRYPELLCAGYVEYERGFKWVMEKRILEITEHFYGALVQ